MTLLLLAALSFAGELRADDAGSGAAFASVTLSATLTRPLAVTEADVQDAPAGTVFVTVLADDEGGRVVTYEDADGWPVEPEEEPATLLSWRP